MKNCIPALLNPFSQIIHSIFVFPTPRNIYTGNQILLLFVAKP